MTPHTVAKCLVTLGIDWVSITDHNSTRNLAVFSKVLASYGIRCLPGVEVQTMEDVHVLCYLPDLDSATSFGSWIESHLPAIEVDMESRGYSLLVDENDTFIEAVEKPFFLPVSLDLDSLFHGLEQHLGIGVYAHIDRSMGIIEQMGFVPPLPAGVGCEIHQLKKIHQLEPYIQGRPRFASSDAHHPDALSEARMEIRCESRAFDELVLAMGNQEKRSIRLCI